MLRITKTALIFSCFLPTASFADEISDTLESALKAYNEGDIKYAIEELDFARQQLKSLKTADLAGFLPEAPDGWTREISNDVSSGLAILGGGTGTEATYAKDDARFTITIMADNPMIGAMSGMLGNAGLLGMKLERVGRLKFINQDGELSTVVDNRIMIQATGQPNDVMIPVLEKIDAKALEQFGR